jgi:hypothetical protein
LNAISEVVRAVAEDYCLVGCVVSIFMHGEKSGCGVGRENQWQ